MHKQIPFGKYLLIERVNVGGMAEVYKAKSVGVQGFERMLAIKRILPNIAEDDEFITMFIDEARISVQLTHSNVGQIYDLGKIEGSYFIAMEYISGKDMRAIFDRMRKRGEPLPMHFACFIVSKLCDGLDYAHRKKDAAGRPMNIVHRDVSPQNVIVSFEGEVKVIDFGIAKAANKASRTQAGILKGKLGYMSPEQVRGLPIDRRSDVFAVGVCLYEQLTGERLFYGTSDFSTLEKVRRVDVVPPSTFNPRVPRRLDDIVMKALAKDVEDRYQWCSELAEDLQRFLIETQSLCNTADVATFMMSVFADEIERQKLQAHDSLAAPLESLVGYPLDDADEDDDEALRTQLFDPTAHFDDQPTSRSISAEASQDLLDQTQPRMSNDAEPQQSEASRIRDSAFLRGGAPFDSREEVLPALAASASKPALPTISRSPPPAPTAVGPPVLRPVTSPGVCKTAPPPLPTKLPGLHEQDADEASNRSTLSDRPDAFYRPPFGHPSAKEQVHLKDKARLILYGGLAALLCAGLALAVFLILGHEPKATGVLIVRGSPVGAEVFIDGEKVGQLTYVNSRATPGTLSLRVGLDGYVDYEEIVRIPPGDMVDLTVTLESAAAMPASLLVVSAPLDARVLFNGEVVKDGGDEPWRARAVAAGERHTLVVKKPGYWPHELDWVPDPGEEKTFTVSLEKAVGRLTIDSLPSGAEVFVRGKARGRTPLDLDDVDGTETHLVELKGVRCHEDWSSTVSFDGVRERRISASMKAIPGCAQTTQTASHRTRTGRRTSNVAEPQEVSGAGTLSLNTRPGWAWVVINGEDTGRHTPLVDYELSAGAHSVTLRAPDGREQTIRVTIRPGEMTRETVDLE